MKIDVRRLGWIAAGALGALVAAGAVLPGEARAFSGGLFNQARPGCTCHGLGEPSPSTRLFILGLPAGQDPTQPTGYVPDQVYDLTVLVAGAPPVFYGFGLEIVASGGSLQSADGFARLRVDNECTRTNNFGVVADPACEVYDADNAACSTCNPSAAGCRPCDGARIVGFQATHGFPNQPGMWALRWKAPPAGSGPVTIYMAGNAVNGAAGADPTDTWSRLGSDSLQPIMTIPEGEQAGPLVALP